MTYAVCLFREIELFNKSLFITGTRNMDALLQSIVTLIIGQGLENRDFGSHDRFAEAK